MLDDIAMGILGLLAGIIVNYLADILPLKRRLSKPICVHCLESQPAAPYFFWPRRCPHCGRARYFRTWVVETVFVLLFIALWRTPQMQRQLGIMLGALVLIYFGVVVVIDMEWRLILHPVSIFGAVFGLLAGTYLHGFQTTIIGGLAGYGIMLVFFSLGSLFAKLVARLRGRRLDEVALGFGDVNLTGVLGLIVGWPNVLMMLIITILAGGLVSGAFVIITFVIGRYKAFTAIPYGPFLILGAFLLLFFPAFSQQILVRLSPLFSIGL